MTPVVYQDTGLNNSNYTDGNKIYLNETISTDEIDIEVTIDNPDMYNNSPTLRIGIINDYLVNTLNNGHSFDFIDTENLQWNKQGIVNNCIDTQLIPEIIRGRANLETQFFVREMPLDKFNSPLLIKHNLDLKVKEN